MNALEARLRSDKLEVAYEAAKEAVALGGNSADRLLAEALPDTRREGAIFVAGALAQTRGPFGVPALLRFVAEGEKELADAQCAALFGIALRADASATPVCIAAFRRRSPTVSDCAAHSLAAIGDERALDDVFAKLQRQLARPKKRKWAEVTEVQVLVTYLARHATRDDSRAALVDLLRRRWKNLKPEEQAWLARLWPGISPDGPDCRTLAPPDGDVFRSWLFSQPPLNVARH